MSATGMYGAAAGGIGGIQELLNQYLSQMTGGGPEQFIGESQPGVNPIQGMDPSTMLQGAMPVTPGDISGMVGGLRGAAGLAGRVKAGLGFGRETLENPGAAAALGGSPLGGFADDAAGAIRGDLPINQVAPPGAPPLAQAANAPAPPNPYMPQGGLGPAASMAPPGPSAMGSSSPDLAAILQQLPPEAMQMIQSGVPVKDVLVAFMSGGL